MNARNGGSVGPASLRLDTSLRAQANRHPAAEAVLVGPPQASAPTVGEIVTIRYTR
jgi:hypothetical protein